MALGHLHSLGVLYRDLKPENILMGLDGHVCITDFGLSKVLENGDPTKTYCGTPEYMAPEVIKQKPHGFMVDWWTLGVLTYELVCGHPPMYHSNQMQMYKMILNKPVTLPSHVSQECKYFLVQLLQKDSTKRLGVENDFQDIKNHPWFQDMDWNKLYKKEIIPLYKPKNPAGNAIINGKKDEKTQVAELISNFDDEFTNQPVRESLAAEVELQFQNFTFQTDNVLDG